MPRSARENAEQNDTKKAKNGFKQSDRSSSARHVPDSNTEDSELKKRERKWSKEGKDYFLKIRGKVG